MRVWELDRDYADLVDEALENGVNRTGRNAASTAVFGRMLKHDMRVGFPIITTRRIYWKPVLAELAAFIEGTRSLARFEELGCKYWRYNAEQWPGFDGDDLGPIYGAQWRNFGGVDQLYELVQGLEANPNGRRHILTTWNPPELQRMCLPPCHLLAQFHCDKRTLHCTVYMRSVDLCLGLPSDLVLYGALLQLIAQEVDRQPGELTFMLGDAHVYDAHDATWQVQRQRISKVMAHGPVLALRGRVLDFRLDDAQLLNYLPHEALKYDLL